MIVDIFFVLVKVVDVNIRYYVIDALSELNIPMRMFVSLVRLFG